jgi:diadenosine tetraphosphate (Ap4A) HIT family hydrolase
MPSDCPFCAPEPGRVLRAAENALALRDAFPLSEGHTLVVPVRHAGSLFDLSDGERADVWALVAEVRNGLAGELEPDGFTIGVNDGEAAGQTVHHAHVHVIPRWSGDVPDPTGGIRHVIPGRARYWERG